MAEAKKVTGKRECLVCLLWFCCVLLTVAVFTFSMYTTREFATLKVRIYELEERQLKLIRDNNIDYKQEDSVEDSRSTRRSNKEKSNSAKQRIPGIRFVGEIIREKPTNRSNVFIHLSGGRNNGVNVTDHNGLIKHWTVSHSTDHVTYNAKKGCITIIVPGYYYIYSQIQLICKKDENEVKSHETFVNNKRVLSSILGYRDRQRSEGTTFDTNYQGGVFKLHNGDRIFVRGNNKRGWVKKEANYFGTFMLAATAF